MALGKTIWFDLYQLASPAPLNAVSSRRVHQGALLRFEEYGGFACLHPWPELGDAPLVRQLEFLQRGQTTSLIGQAETCARADGLFRAAGRSWFDDLPEQPRNHWLVRGGEDFDEVRQLGFDTVKLKIGPDAVRDDQKAHFNAAAAAGFKLRLDANESLSKNALLAWWKSLSDESRAAVEFVEDPCPFLAEDWEELSRAGLPLAADREAEARIACCPWAVVKPAVTDTNRFLARCAPKRVVFTSYMDHPLGQMWAAREAARHLAKRAPETCGLLTHRCFEPNEFSERIAVRDTRLVFKDGTGAGFDDLLEKLPWKRLR